MAHASSPDAAGTDWAEIVGLYDVLWRLDPSPVIELNRAVAVARFLAVAGVLAVSCLLKAGGVLAVAGVGVPGRAAGGLVGGKLAVGGLPRLGLMPAGAAADPAERGARRIVGDGGCREGDRGQVGLTVLER